MPTANETYQTKIDQVFAAIKEFEQTQRKHIASGASDTEPDGVFQQLIDQAARGEGPAVPRTGRGWELLTLSGDCEPAAKDLHDAALKVVQLIESCTIQEAQPLQKRLRDYCWRLY